MNYPNLIIGCSMVIIGSAWIYLSTKSQSVPLSKQAIVNKIAHPGYGACYRCERTWDVVKGHYTNYINYPRGESPNGFKGWDCFPLCEKCWNELRTPEARLPYYRSMVNDWSRMDRSQDEPSENKWPLIKAAVLAGK